jgi:type IV secretion system protein VirB5
MSRVTSHTKPTVSRAKSIVLVAAVLLTVTAAPRSDAMIPVVDIGAILQLLMQIQTLNQQLSTAKDTLTQAQDQFQSTTGNRGMDQLLRGTVRNYLPSNWAELTNALGNATATYSNLTSRVQQVMRDNAVLSAVDLSRVSDTERRELEAGRRSVAMLQMVTREALSTTSGRFASIQQLIDAIPRATDQKAILDLQARIGAEQGMLENEQSKLQVLYQAAQAEEWASRQRQREEAIADIGSLRNLPRMGL